ncbi:hypothetical protein DOY81_003097 [Sarcophaga bullata]|nr:hypothetical protein DOY81_003097 [Sarcophaga bullata]
MQLSSHERMPLMLQSIYLLCGRSKTIALTKRNATIDCDNLLKLFESCLRYPHTEIHSQKNENKVISDEIKHLRHVSIGLTVIDWLNNFLFKIGFVMVMKNDTNQKQ